MIAPKHLEFGNTVSPLGSEIMKLVQLGILNVQREMVSGDQYFDVFLRALFI